VVCAVCGTRAVLGDVYCGECGRPLAADTAIIERLAPVAPPSPLTPEAVLARPELAREPEPEPEPEPVPESALEPEPEPVPESALEPVTVTVPEFALEPVPVPAPEPVPAPVPTMDVESTRIVPRGTGGARFVLQFSTGESYTVMGSGLAGRNPQPEPGEYVDHLVTIVDPARSVSKTHFEFGQRDTVFWFSDRHSGNGSVIREPGAEPRVCEPGRRYPIVRGTRVDIGEQFVIVS
jgi:hypothetical protein